MSTNQTKQSSSSPPKKDDINFPKLKTPNSANPKSSNQNPTKPTFSGIAKKSPKPRPNVSYAHSKEQGIIFPAIDGITIEQYIIGVGDTLDFDHPENVTFASRISNGRILIFLATTDLVNKFITKHQGISIDGKFIPARKYVNPSKRITMSNVLPTIPNEELENHLKKLNIIPTSKVSFVKAATTNSRYSHVMSGRRQVYVNDNCELPSIIEVKYSDETYTVFITSDEMVCYNCKMRGHISSSCKANATDIGTEEIPKNCEEENLTTNSEASVMEEGLHISTKRQLDSTTSVSTDHTQDNLSIKKNPELEPPPLKVKPITKKNQIGRKQAKFQ